MGDQILSAVQKKAHFWANVLGRLCGVRAVFLSGSLVTENADSLSDIDFFIIAKRGQIWTARFFIFLVLRICGQLATEKKHAGRICPNHFVVEDFITLRQQNAYTAEMFSRNIPLYDPYDVYLKFAKANTWVNEFGCHFSVKNNGSKRLQEPQNPTCFVRILERFLRWVQYQKIKRNPLTQLPGAQIVLTNKELRFHPRPKSPPAPNDPPYGVLTYESSQ